MTTLRKKSSPRDTSRTSACRTRVTSPRPSDPLASLRRRRARERARDGRTRPAPCRGRRAAWQTIARVGIVLEEAVGDGPQTIVGAGQRLAHGVFGARIVEAGQQHERAVAHVAVGVLADGLQERGNGLRRRRAAHRARGVGAGGVIEVAELVDRGLELGGRHGLRCGRLLRRGRRAVSEQQRRPAIRRRRVMITANRRDDAVCIERGQPIQAIASGYSTTAAVLSSFSASCR